MEQVRGRLATEENRTSMLSLFARRIPVKGTLVKSCTAGGYSVASSVEGDIHVLESGAYNDSYKCPYNVRTFDQDGEEKYSVNIGEYHDVKGLASARIDGADMIVLSTHDSIDIRQRDDGKLIDSLYLSGFKPARNAICMTPNNNILVCSSESKVIECEIKDMKIIKTEKFLNVRVESVYGLCYTTYDNRELVIATWYVNHGNRGLIAVDYETGDVVWRKDHPACDGIEIGPMDTIDDGEGNLFLSDSDNNRICMMTPDGKIHHSLLQNKDASRFYHQAWIPGQKRLVVKDNHMLYMYDISYE